MNQNNLKKASNILRAIAHPVRMAIVMFIAEKGTTNVNTIYNSLKLEQSITSQHLRILRNAELVETTRDGKFIHYSVNIPNMVKLNAAVKKMMQKKVDIDFDLEDMQLEGPDGNHNGQMLNGKEQKPKKASKSKTS